MHKMPMTTEQAAKLIGVGKRRIQKLIEERRIPGAEKVGRDWMLPDNFTVLPTAERASHHPAMKIQVDPHAAPPPPLKHSRHRR